MAEKMERSTSKKQVPLRISDELYTELLRWADDEFRSVNGQIEYLLSECVEKRRKKLRNQGKDSK